MFLLVSFLDASSLGLMRIYPCVQFKLSVIGNINVLLIKATITKLLVEGHVVSSTQPTFR